MRTSTDRARRRRDTGYAYEIPDRHSGRSIHSAAADTTSGGRDANHAHDVPGDAAVQAVYSSTTGPDSTTQSPCHRRTVAPTDAARRRS